MNFLSLSNSFSISFLSAAIEVLLANKSPSPSPVAGAVGGAPVPGGFGVGTVGAGIAGVVVGPVGIGIGVGGAGIDVPGGAAVTPGGGGGTGEGGDYLAGRAPAERVTVAQAVESGGCRRGAGGLAVAAGVRISDRGCPAGGRWASAVFGDN